MGLHPSQGTLVQYVDEDRLDVIWIIYLRANHFLQLK